MYLTISILILDMLYFYIITCSKWFLNHLEHVIIFKNLMIIIINNIYKAQNTKVSKHYTENIKLQLTLHLKLQQNDNKHN